METVLIRKPSVEVLQLVETECIVREARRICTAPPGYKCPYRKVRIIPE